MHEVRHPLVPTSLIPAHSYRSVPETTLISISYSLIVTMMQGHAIELLKGIRELFCTRGLQATVQWHALHLERIELDACALLHVAEVHRVNSAALSII